MPNNRVALAAVIAGLAFPGVGLASVCAFLTITTTGVQSSQFISLNGNGIIAVSDTWTSGSDRAGESDNNA